MSKLVRVSDEVYDKLDAIREKRETFSEAVERIIEVYTKMQEVSDTLGPAHFLKERSEARLERL
ncbi:hypothetical protein ES703_15117 [subsurface metagenome]